MATEPLISQHVTHQLVQRPGVFVPALEVQNISYWEDGKAILDGISLSVGQETPFGIFGHRGCGKTTFIKHLLGLIPPRRGDGHVFGFDIRTEGAEIRKVSGYAGGGWRLPANMTLRTLLNQLLELRATPEENREALIESVLYFLSLSKFIDTSLEQIPSQASYKVSLAQALIHKPRVLFLDDIPAFLNPFSRREFYDILKALFQLDGLTPVITSSDAEYFLDVVDTGAFFVEGRIVGTGNLAALASHHSAGTLHELYFALAAKANHQE